MGGKMPASEPNGYAGWYNRVTAEPPGKVAILDSTLREGEQSPGVSFTMRQRLQIAWMLDYFGVDAIEISPIISQDHEETCRALLKEGLRAPIIVHVRALPQDIDIALSCGAERLAIYYPVSDQHLRYKVKLSRDAALRRMVEAVEYTRSHGLSLRFTMEDASRADPKFLVQACRAVRKAGADRIGLPDTVGIMLPQGMHELVSMVHKAVDAPLDVHCHNDLGLAVANSLAGMEAGASQIHVTVNGLGERVGIAPLAEVAVNLALAYKMKLNVKLEMLRELSELVEKYTGVKTPASKPLVGENAYKHKAGTHVAAIIRNPFAYEFIHPRLVGNSRRIIFGELLGKSGAAFLLKVLGLEPDIKEATQMAQGLKRLRCGDLFELDLSEEMEMEAVRAEERIHQD